MLRYTAFVLARHAAWANRRTGAPRPWSDDPVVNSRKFTNVFRLLDPGTQYVFRLFEDGPRDALARLLLYRQTNHPDVWETIGALEGLPAAGDLRDPRWYAVLNTLKDGGAPVFNPAYLIYPGHVKGANKVGVILERTASFMEERAGDFLRQTTLEGQVNVLRSHPGVDDFIAMQVATDFNYGPWSPDRENDFILCGPGARKGAAYLSPLKPEEVVRVLRRQWLQRDDAPTLPTGRPLSLMDVQNTLCEFSKYQRYLGKVPGAAYEPAHPGAAPEPILPHWA